MAKENGGKLWEQIRTESIGRPRVFTDPVELWELACDYFFWCDTHAYEKEEIVKFKDTYTTGTTEQMRPYTEYGLCAFLGVSPRYLYQAERELVEKQSKKRSTEEEDALLETIGLIKTCIRDQQVSGATAGAFNAHIVGLVNGLVNRHDVTTKGAPIINVEVADVATAEAIELLEHMDDDRDPDDLS